MDLFNMQLLSLCSGWAVINPGFEKTSICPLKAMTFPFFPEQGVSLNLTVNFRGINTSAYEHTNCRSSICGGIEELKSLMVSHVCSKPVAVTCFVLLFNKGHYTCWSCFVCSSKSPQIPDTLIISEMVLPFLSQWRRVKTRAETFASGSLLFAHTHDVRPRNHEIQMLHQNTQTYKVLHHETEVPDYTDGARIKRRSSDRRPAGGATPWNKFCTVLSEVGRTRLLRARPNVHTCHFPAGGVSESSPLSPSQEWIDILNLLWFQTGQIILKTFSLNTHTNWHKFVREFD